MIAKKSKTPVATVTVSAADVNAGVAAVQSEILQARAALDAAAFAAAQAPTKEHRQALTDARTKLAALEDEAGGLQAVGREVKRIELRAHVQAEIARLKEEEAEALACIDSAAHSFERVYKAILELDEGVVDMLEKERVANLAYQAKQFESSDAREPAFALPTAYHMDTLVADLLWLATRRLGVLNLQRSESVMDISGKPCPERTLEAVEYKRSNARRQVEAASTKLVSAAEQRLAGI